MHDNILSFWINQDFFLLYQKNAFNVGRFGSMFFVFKVWGFLVGVTIAGFCTASGWVRTRMAFWIWMGSSPFLFAANHGNCCLLIVVGQLVFIVWLGSYTSTVVLSADVHAAWHKCVLKGLPIVKKFVIMTSMMHWIIRFSNEHIPSSGHRLDHYFY